MSITSQHGRRVFALEVGGLEYRYHSSTPPSSSNLSSTIATGINYTDLEGIVSVGDFSAQVDPSGGVADYDAVTISLSIDRRRGGAGDPGIIFGRCGARSSSTRSQISASVARDATSISTASDLSSLSYPRLLHIGAETVRASVASSSAVTCSRGVGNTPTQTHSIDLEGSVAPELTTTITTFRGRRAKLYMAHRYPSGAVSDYVEVINGFIGESPYIEEGDTVSLSLLPLTALIDTSISDKGIGQTRLLQGYHYYDGVNGSAIEYAMSLDQQPALSTLNSIRVQVVTSSTVTANTFEISTADFAQFTEVLQDFDPSLPTGPEGDDYPAAHPRYPAFRRGGLFSLRYGQPEVYATALTYDSTIPGYVVNADSSVTDALTAAEITAAQYLFLEYSKLEVKRHTLGDQEVKQWPNVINDVLESDGPSAATGLSGAVARWRLTPDDELKGEKLSDSPWPVDMVFWSDNTHLRQYAQTAFDVSYAPRVWTSRGVMTYLASQARFFYPLYAERPLQRLGVDDGELIKLRVSGSDLVGSVDIHTPPEAYYQHYESTILVENSLGLPSSAGDNVYDVVVRYIDLEADEEREQIFKVTHESTATFGGSDVGVLLHIADDNEHRLNSSFGDWRDKDRALIFRGGQLTRERPGEALLRLLESGGGGEINGTYDTLGVGLNLDSSLIDEDSFLAADAAATIPFTGSFVGDGQDLRSVFDGVLKMLGSVLVMKRDETTGQSKITLTPIGYEKTSVVAATVEASEWIADPPPYWGIYEDLVTQVKYSYDYSPDEDKLTSEVLFNNQEAITRYGGERSKIELQLPGVSSRLFGRGAGDTFSFFLPTSSRIFNLLSNPLREWVGEIGTGQSTYLDVGSYIKVSSPHLRGYEDAYGVTDGIGMIRGIRQSLEGEGCELSIITVGIAPVNWNSAMRVASVVSSTTIEVESNQFTTTAQGRDSDFFKAGDVVQHIPRGNHDAAGAQLTILSVSGNLIKFTTAHSISAGGDTIEPATYSAASSIHKEDAYLANTSDIINVTTDAQEFN
jgi:hypothetical protein